MQGATKATTVVDPSTSHFVNALQVNASASLPQILHISGESSFKESREEDRRKKSSWIRRLKPRDAWELSEGGSEEGSLEMTYLEKGNSCERRDLGTGIVQSTCFLQEKPASRVRARPNWQIERVQDAKRQKASEQKDSNVQRSGICLDTRTTIEQVKSTSSAIPSNVGFGPWVSFSSCRKPELKPESALGSKVSVGMATTSTQESSKDIQGNSCSMFSITNAVPRCSPASMVGDVSASAVACKSPLSPVHSKLGLPPRPPSQKSPGFHPSSKVAPLSCWMGQEGFHQFAQDGQPSRQAFETWFNKQSKPSVGVQDKDTRELAEAAVSRSESFFQKLNPLEQSFSDSMREHGKGLSDCRMGTMGNGNQPLTQAKPSMAERAATHIAVGQPPGGYSNDAVVEYENNKRGACEDLQLNASKEGGRGPISPNLPSDNMDLHLKVSMPGTENPKSALKNGSTSMEPKKKPMQQLPSGSSHGASTCEKADASASISASLPWEMFIKSAGTSSKAREEFVEVYNRARDELKNQRMSQRMSRALVKEIDGGPKLTLGSDGTVLKCERHSVTHSQAQGRLDVPSGYPEHRTLSLASSSKKQQSISLIESKGPVTTLVNERSGLQRDNGSPSKLDTPWKQADDFRLEQSLPEGQAKPSDKMNVQESDEQIACQRLDERSVVHIKEAKSADKGPMFSSNTAASTREVASKRQEGNGLGQTAGLSHQLDDRKESTSALGKRSHVTFEEHSISRVMEKGVVSRVRPQSRPHVWLQRWHSPAAYNSTIKVSPDTQVASDAKRSESVSYLAFGLKKFKDGDDVGIFGRSKEFKNVLSDNEKGVKSLATSPSKMLPSAAAMAIVGTAARQFCSAQPQRKGSFAFWSGFGRPPRNKVEPVQEKGKAKTFSKADVNMPNC